MKAYSVITNLDENAKALLKNNNIELTENKDNTKIFNEQEVVSLLNVYDILLIGIRTLINKNILNHVQTPKIIATLSIGLDHIDKEVIESELVKVINIKDANIVSVAEHIFSLILALNKRLFEANTLILNKKGYKNNIENRPVDISNKTLGLIGAGNITKEVIKIANAFQMKMLCYTKNPCNHQNLHNFVTFKSLDEVLRESDIINVSIPLNEETKYLISDEKIKLMKPTATFINTSRRDVVDMKALIKYADENKNFYVGLDIDVDEYDELLSKYRKNVIVSPHIAGVSSEALERMDMEIAEKIIEYISRKEG